MATAAQTARKPSVALRRVQADLQQIVRDDQESDALGVAEGIHRIVSQLDRLAGMQELFEWWSSLPL